MTQPPAPPPISSDASYTPPLPTSSTPLGVEKGPTAFQYAWRNPWVRLLVFLLLGAAAYFFAGQIVPILASFAVAYLIAYIANPMLNWFERGRVPRGLGVLFVLLIFGGILTMAGVLLSAIAQQLTELVRQLPTWVSTLETWADSVAAWLQQRGVSGVEDMRQQAIDAVQNYGESIGRQIPDLLQNLLNPQNALLSSLMTIGSALGQFVIIILLSVYLMLDYSRVNTAMLKMFPRPWQPRVLEFTDLAAQAIGGYVRGQLLIAAAVGTMVALGLWAIGIPSALAIGFLAGVFNIIPYLGPIIGAIPALLFAAPMGLVKMALVVAVFVGANQLEGSFLSPLVLSKTTDLHPITVLLSILIGAALFGFAGALIAVPLVALGKLALEKYYYGSKVYTQGP